MASMTTVLRKVGLLLAARLVQRACTVGSSFRVTILMTRGINRQGMYRNVIKLRTSSRTRASTLQLPLGKTLTTLSDSSSTPNDTKTCAIAVRLLMREIAVFRLYVPSIEFEAAHSPPPTPHLLGTPYGSMLMRPGKVESRETSTLRVELEQRNYPIMRQTL